MSDESIWKQIEEHRAIPRGGWKFAAGMSIASFALLPLFTTLAILFGWLPASLTDLPTRIVLGVGAFEGLALAWFVFFSPTDLWPKPWLRAYCRKNVRGYIAWRLVVAGNGTGEQEFHLCNRGDHDAHPPRHTVSISIPLGGWFAKPQVFWRGKPSRWRVLPRQETDTRDVVRLRDSHGAVMVMPIEDALCIIGERLARALHEPFFHDTTDIPFSWTDIHIETREQRDDTKRDLSRVEASRRTISDELATTVLALTKEQAAHQRTREQAEIRERQLDIDRQLIADQRDAAQVEAQQYREKAVCAEAQLELTDGLYRETLVFLEGLVEQFKKSGRCRAHLESLRILHRLLHFLPSRFGDSSEKFMRYSDARAAVSGQIHDLERRDKRGHARRKQREVTATT